MDTQSGGEIKSARDVRRRVLFFPRDSDGGGQRLDVYLRRCPLLQLADVRSRRLENHPAAVDVRSRPRCLRHLLRDISGTLPKITVAKKY